MSDAFDQELRRQRLVRQLLALTVTAIVVGSVGYWLWTTKPWQPDGPRQLPEPGDGMGFPIDVELDKTRTKKRKCHIDLKLRCPERVEATVKIRGFDKKGSLLEQGEATVAVHGTGWAEVVLKRPCRRFKRFEAEANGFAVK